MTMEQMIRAIVREEIRTALREELRGGPQAAAPAGEPRWLTITQVARATGFSTRTVRRWIESGQLAATKHRHRLRVSRTDLETFMRTAPAAEGTVVDVAEIARSLRVAK